MSHPPPLIRPTAACTRRERRAKPWPAHYTNRLRTHSFNGNRSKCFRRPKNKKKIRQTAVIQVSNSTPAKNFIISRPCIRDQGAVLSPRGEGEGGVGRGGVGNNRRRARYERCGPEIQELHCRRHETHRQPARNFFTYYTFKYIDSYQKESY